MYSVISEIPFTGTKQSLMLPPVLCFSALRNKSTANKHVYCSLQLQGGTSSSHAMGISSKVSGGLMGFHFHPIDEYILLFTSNESSALFVIHMDNNITLVASCLVCYWLTAPIKTRRGNHNNFLSHLSVLLVKVADDIYQDSGGLKTSSSAISVCFLVHNIIIIRYRQFLLLPPFSI